ncbi:MAG: hypothetical protein HC838_17070, partial [Spirulinaceae cyanobacterium RM2_2_10]|nr:hypothetical protein [Spirulinaceae cyanobacterium RM2_2_10]
MASFRNQTVPARHRRRVSLLLVIAATSVNGGLIDHAHAQSEPACPAPALSQLTRHRVQSGESFTTIGAQYDIAPAVLGHF